MKEKRVIDSKTIMTEMIMPNDTNPLGNLMGGNLLRWMDIAAGICAAKHCEAHVVTASVDHVSFDLPIILGSVITIEANVTRAYTTSVEVYVEVQAAEITGANPKKSNHAYFSFVGLDESTKKPTRIPQVIPVSSVEVDLFQSALRRRQLRLIIAGRMKPEDAKEIRSLFMD